MKNRKYSICCLIVLLFLAGAVAPPARAVIPILDGLDGPCCLPAQVNLPQFPPMVLDSKYVCWRNCGPGLSGNVKATLTPVPAACGIYLLRYTVTNQGGNLTAWSGTLVMTYSRTWLEARVDPANPDIQIWRFLLNGDLKVSNELIDRFGNNTCVVAPCAPVFNRNIHVSGYIDYAQDCNTGQFEIAYALDHDCDLYEHQSGFSCRQGNYHSNQSYSWVGPSAGFQCEPGLPAADGPVFCEAFRNYNFNMPLNNICETEQPILQGAIQTEAEFCPCTSVPAAPQYKLQQYGAMTACNSLSNSVNVDVFPGLLSKSIGFWTDPARYPGPELLHLERSMADYVDGCSQQGSIRHFRGVMTQEGYFTYKLTPAGFLPLPPRMLDLGDATLPNMNGQPLIGKRTISERMKYFWIDFF